MSEPVTHEQITSWADNPNGPVALHLRQKLVPVEGEDAVIFPPTYADIGYAIDTLSDGTKVAQIDSVGSQANRMEPLFKYPPLRELVPQIEIAVGNEKTVSILDVGHRLGDALVRSTDLAKEVKSAFEAFQKRCDPGPIAKLAPTTLVFGAWDSRGSGAKLPRLVQSTIRAWDVDALHRAAQYNPPIDYVLEGVLEESDDKGENDARSELGFRHVPAIWRDKEHTERHLGGIIVRGEIRRDVTVNFVPLRALGNEQHKDLRRYLLGLALAVVVQPQDGYLRQGCHLVPIPEAPAAWTLVQRNGERLAIDAHAETVLSYARTTAQKLGVGSGRVARFDAGLARSLIDEKKGGKAKGGKERASTAGH